MTEHPDNIERALTDVQAILSTLYPLTYGCYYGGIEFKNNAAGYVESAQNPKQIVINLINSAGLIYDATFYFLKYWNMQTTEVLHIMDSADYFFRLGVYFGINLDSIFTGTDPDFFVTRL